MVFFQNSFVLGATVVSWRVNNQEQLFVRYKTESNDYYSIAQLFVTENLVDPIFK